MRILFFTFFLGMFAWLYAGFYDETHDIEKLIRYKQTNQYQKAVDFSKEVITRVRSKPFSKEREATLVALYVQMSELYLHTHQTEQALNWLEKTAQIKSRFVPKPYQQKLLPLFYTLGQRDMTAGNNKRAMLFMHQAYRFALSLHGEESVFSLNSALDLGKLYYDSGRYHEAASVMKRAYRVIKRNYPKENIERLKAASSLGGCLMMVGEYEEALTYLQYALKYMKENDNKSAKYLASLHNIFALTYIRTGEYPKARKHLQSAQDIKKRYGQQDVSLVKIYNHIGMLAQYMGDWENAKNAYERALELLHKLHLKNKTVLRAVYANLAQFYMDQGQNQKAALYYKKALGLIEKGQIERAYILSNLSLLYLSEGALPKARSTLEQSLALKKKYLGKSHLSLVTTYLNMAALNKEENSPRDALVAEKKALKILKNTHSQYDLLQRTYYALSETYAMLGNRGASYKNISKSVEYFLKLKITIYNMSSQREKRSFKKMYEALIKHYFAVTYAYMNTLDKMSRQKTAQAIFANWVKIKRSIFDVSEAFSLLAHTTKNKETKVRVEKLFSAQRHLARFYQEHRAERTDQGEGGAWVKRLRDTIETQEKYLSNEIRKTNIAGLENAADTAALPRYIPDGALYIDFAKIAARYYFFSVDGKGHYDLRYFDKKQSEQIENQIKKIYIEIADISTQRHFADTELAQNQYGKLYELLSKNIHFDQAKSLILSTDGLLNVLPFEALFDSEKKQYLLDTMPIRYVRSEKEIIPPISSKPHVETTASSVTVFANPDFDANLSVVAKKKQRVSSEVLPKHFSPLPGTMREAAVIRKLFPSAKLYTGKQATETALLNMHAPRILHIATHGFFLEKNRPFSLWMQTGIALSAANNTLAGKTGNGIVSGLELAGLDLHGTGLVVLSSCYSEMGEVENGEGVIGLAEAFRKAGANHVIGSLWAVSDRWGETLMQAFYTALKEGKRYDDALREAKHFVIKKGAVHPYFWAGFVLR